MMRAGAQDGCAIRRGRFCVAGGSGCGHGITAGVIRMGSEGGVDAGV